MNYLDYRERLGIGFDDDQKFYALRNKAVLLAETVRTRLSCGDYRDSSFVDYFMIASEVPQYNGIVGVRQSFKMAKNFKELLWKMIIFSNTITKHITRPDAIRLVKQFPCVALEELRIKYEIFEDDEGIFIFPKGAEELDNALVSQPLAWLSEYPKAHTAFTKALKEYADASPENASDIADKFRKSLETFMQEFFDTDKTLENCKAIYGGYLKEHGVPKEISGNLETLLNSYTTFMNGYAKHHDNTNINILEYIMYQTGNIIRLLITLKQGENENAD